MAFWNLFKRRDPLESQVSMIVRSAVRWEKKHPGRPIHECFNPIWIRMIRASLQDGSNERLSFDSIIEADPPISDVREFCCAVMEVLTGVTPDRETEYAKLVQLVDAELALRRGR